MIQTKLKGMGVALITPFKEDESVDYDALMRLVDYQLQNNTDFLCVLGTTAETPTLSADEKKKIQEMVIERVNGKIPILLGVGGNCTKSVVDALKTGNYDGVDAILSVVPYYNKPSQEGIYQHYKAISEASPRPIVLYNVPGRTGVNMLPDTVIRLSKVKNIIGVKEASGSLDQAGAILQHTDESFDVISGEDSLTFPMMAMGAKGVISVVANVAPKKMAQMCHAVLDNDMLLGRKLHYELLDLCKGVFFETNPIPAKKAAYMMGLVENEIRLPLVEMTKENTQKLKSIMEKLNIKIVRD